MNEILELLRGHRGKFGHVVFRKKNGELRKMNFRQGVGLGVSPLKGGNWSNSAAKASDYHLVLVTDIDEEKQKLHSRRSFNVNRVIYLKIGGETFGSLK